MAAPRHHGRTRRLLAGAAALLFALALATRGLCPMASMERDGETAGHACCHAGLQAATPGCCLDAPRAERPAREAPVVPALAPPASFVLLAAPPAPRAAPALPAPPPSASPPLLVLRV
jgi:hypothetical protein